MRKGRTLVDSLKSKTLYGGVLHYAHINTVQHSTEEKKILRPDEPYFETLYFFSNNKYKKY